MAPAGDGAPLALWLKDVPAKSHGRPLGLMAGDILLAVDGRAFTGNAVQLAQRLAERAGKASALTFQRGPNRLTVLSRRADLGLWDTMAAPEMPADDASLDPDRLVNWEVLRSPDGVFDLYRLAPSLAASVLPPVWLLHMRLWMPFATLATALAVAAAVQPVAAAAVWIAAGWHLRHAAPAYLRADRRARGMTRPAVYAARTESAAIAAHLEHYPNDRSVFGPAPRAETRPA